MVGQIHLLLYITLITIYLNILMPFEIMVFVEVCQNMHIYIMLMSYKCHPNRFYIYFFILGKSKRPRCTKSGVYDGCVGAIRNVIRQCELVYIIMMKKNFFLC